jgi:hypothetical protein
MMSLLLLNSAAGSDKAGLLPATLAYSARRPASWPSRGDQAARQSGSKGEREEDDVASV